MSDFNIDYRLFTVSKAIQDIRMSGFDARVQTLYGAAGEPSIVIVVPGLKLVEGELEAVTRE